MNKHLEVNFFEIQTKSEKRVRDFGEVFTPEKYVNQMLDMLDKSVWSDTNKIFFEPTCGHGNFVISILNKRLNSIYKKAKRRGVKKPYLYAVANTLDTLWAIDVDQENINETRMRVLEVILDFLLSVTNKTSLQLIKANQDFFTHTLCAIDWHIHQNELITSLEKDKKEATKKSLQTKVSTKWMKQGNHKPLDFNLTWVKYFKDLNRLSGVKVYEFKKKSLFIQKILKQNQKVSLSEELANHYSIR